jgi:hypothetical protein
MILPDQEIFCDAETVAPDGYYIKTTQKINVEFGQRISQEKSFSGKNSIKLNNKNQFGFHIVLKDCVPGEYIEASIWKTAIHKGALFAQSDSGLSFMDKLAVGEDSLGWYLLNLNFRVPDSYQGEPIKLYAYANTKDPIYFDDLKIKRFKTRKSTPSITPLVISIEEKIVSKLSKQRRNAIKDGVISKKYKQTEKGSIQHKNDTIPMEIRFKGDWPDHLLTDKWSYRIKISKKDKRYKGMNTFSIQEPYARAFLHEWTFHKFLEKNHILTTKYDFTPVIINGNYKGIYAMEEHFHEFLLERYNKKNGPIFKFSEEAFFEKYLCEFKDHVKLSLPILESAEIRPYQKKKILNKKKLRKLFKKGNNILETYRSYDVDLSELLDFNSFAKMYAACNIFKAYHSLVWHNQRYYMNPETEKIEIIAFDAYSDEGKTIYWDKKAIYGNFNFLDESQDLGLTTNIAKYQLKLFKDKKFVDLYIKYLTSFSDESYLNTFFSSINDDMQKCKQLLQEENPRYTYDFEMILEQAKNIRATIEEYKKRVNSPNYSQLFDKYIKPVSYTKPMPFSSFEYLVKAYSKKSDDNRIVNIYNYNTKQLSVIGSGTTPTYAEDKNFQKKNISQFNDITPGHLRIVVPAKHTYIYLSGNDAKVIKSTKILAWKKGKKISFD